MNRNIGPRPRRGSEKWYYTLDRVSEILDISKEAVVHRIKRRRLKIKRIGNRYVIHLLELEALRQEPWPPKKMISVNTGRDISRVKLLDGVYPCSTRHLRILVDDGKILGETVDGYVYVDDQSAEEFFRTDV